MNDKYVIGSISEVLQSETVNSSNSKQEDTDLSGLFTFNFTFASKEPDEDVAIDDEMIETYLNPTEKESLSARNTSDLKNKQQRSEKKKKKIEEESPERKERTLFVGNIAVNVKKKALMKLFKKYGDIESIRIRSIPVADPNASKRLAYIKKEFHKGRKSMNAYIVFKEKSDAEKAVECNGVVLEGLHLRVDRCANQTHDTSRSLFVGNLPFSVEEDQLRRYFTECGPVHDVRVIRDRKTGIGKGFAYIKFQEKSDVMFGLKLNGSQFEGRTLRVFRAQDQTKQRENHKGSNTSNKSFRGLRSTSSKDLQLGKQLFKTTNSNKANGLRRLNDKKTKANKPLNKSKKIQKHDRKKERNKKKQ